MPLSESTSRRTPPLPIPDRPPRHHFHRSSVIHPERQNDMTPQEQQMLQALTDRVNQTVLSDKDPEAERYLQDTLGRNPDALYILAQTVLVQQYALDQARKQLADARNNAQSQPQPRQHTSFLGNLLGLDDNPRQPTQPPPPPPPQYAPPRNHAPP